MTKRNSSVDFGLYALFIAIGGIGLAFFINQRQLQQNADSVNGTEPAPVVEEVSRAEAWGARRPSPLTADDDDTDPVSFAVEPPHIIKLGWGWSQSRAEAIPTVCVVFEEVDRDNAQDSTIRISEVRDSYAMSKEMKVSAAVSVKTIVASGSGKAEYAKNSSVSSTAVNYLVSAEVMNATKFAGPTDEPTTTRRAAVRLTDDAATLARRNLEAFQDICGEGYVSSVKTGARAYMLASTKTSSSEDRESVRASAEGSGWGVKVSAAASGSDSTSSSKFERTLSFYQQGGNAADGVMTKTKVTVFEGGETKEVEVEFPASDLPSDATEGIARIKKLAETAARAGKIFEASITPYQVLENFPRNADILADEAEQDEIAATWGAYATLYSDLKHVLEEPQDYAVPIRRCSDKDDCKVEFEAVADNAEAIAMVEQLQDMVLIGRDMIEDAAEHCLQAEEHCLFDIKSIRSPYSVRASMPIPIPLEEVVPTAAKTAAARTMDIAVESLTKHPLHVYEQIAAVGNGWKNFKAADAAAEAGQGKTLQQNIDAIDIDDHLTLHLREPSQGRCVYGARTPGCISNAEVRGWAARTGLLTKVTSDPSEVRSALRTCGVSDDMVLTGEADDASAPTIWFPVGVSFDSDGMPVCDKLADALKVPKGEEG